MIFSEDLARVSVRDMFMHTSKPVCIENMRLTRLVSHELCKKVLSIISPIRTFQCIHITFKHLQMQQGLGTMYRDGNCFIS